METIFLNIDGYNITTTRGKSVLEAALEAGVFIPHLCYHPDLPSVDNCKLCIVEIDGREGYPTSCTTPAENGMLVKTATGPIVRLRQQAMADILSRHPSDCGSCNKYLNCELQSLKQYFASDNLNIQYRPKLLPVDSSNPLFNFDPNKCVLCGRCIRACRDLRGVGILDFRYIGEEKVTGTITGLSLAESGCRFCGACAEACPTGAILDKEELTRGKNRKSALVPCRYTCPAEIDVPRYLRFIRDKNYSAAAAVVREKAPFPAILGYVCDRPCEGTCRRGQINQAISIRDLKRFCVGHDSARIWEKNYQKKSSTGKKIAVIGSGPAGLTAAYYLNNQGHEVTVFESRPQPGGMLRYGIPEYRLPRQVLNTEIEYLIMRNIRIHTNTCIQSLDELFNQGFHAVLVAVGTHQGHRLHIPGADHPSTLVGIDFLRAVNAGDQVTIGRSVLVLGGGNVAFDCARVARRLGAEKVQIACLEDRENMPASDDEISQSIEEGISLFPSRTFTRILIENGKIAGVECLEVDSFSFDEDKNLQLDTRSGSQHILEAETVIFAVGQYPLIPPDFNLNTTSSRLIEIDSYTFSTSRDGVFAAGDAVSGTASVIKAIASGRQAAISVDRFLEGSGNIDEKLAPPQVFSNYLGLEAGFARMERCPETCISSEGRMNSFCSVTDDMSEEEALKESHRCLQCDLRLKMTPVKFWGSY